MKKYEMPKSDDSRFPGVEKGLWTKGEVLSDGGCLSISFLAFGRTPARALSEKWTGDKGTCASFTENTAAGAHALYVHLPPPHASGATISNSGNQTTKNSKNTQNPVDQRPVF